MSRRRRIQRIAAIAVTVLACIGSVNVLSPSEPAHGASVLTGPLHTAGNQILDASNNPVRLRGLNRDGLERDTEGWGISDDEISHARDWGANVIRLPLNEEFWMRSCATTAYDPTYIARIDTVVNEVTSRGMIALLTVTMNPRFPCDTSKTQKMADYPGTMLFWQQVAARYKDNPLVAFDLYNEPHDISDYVWLYGGTVNDTGMLWAAAGMQTLYDAVRGTGANNLVFVSGTNWADGVPSMTVKGSNIVYAAHVYTCPNAPPPNCSSGVTKVGPLGLIWLPQSRPNPYDPSPFIDRWDTFETQHPLVITEFGWPDSNDGTYNANVIASAEQKKLGWIAFAWDGTNNGKFNLLATAGPGATYDPSPAGVPVKNGLAIQP